MIDHSRTWEGLNPPYSTVVADPPWEYRDTINPQSTSTGRRGRLPYAGMPLDEIKALPVGGLTNSGRVFLWVTNRYLRHAWDVLEAWGFDPQARTLVWCKQPHGTTPVTTEFILIGSKGSPARMPWHGTTWFAWQRRGGHSVKPPEFLDLVELWCPGPYVELFARAPRLGWDHWGHGYEGGVAA